MTEFRVSSTVLGTPDPRGLADFCRALLPGWETLDDEPEWVKMKPPGGGHGLAFQFEPDHVPPTWPAAPGDQQMQAHLDIGTTALDAGVVTAQDHGARLAAYQPQDDVWVMLDPAGHPCCLFQLPA